MSEPGSLNDTVVRYRELLAECGLGADAHIPGLLRSTGVPEPELRALLAGRTLPPDDPGEAVGRELRKIVFELEVRANPHGALADLGVRHVAGRGANWDSDAIVAVAAMVADIRNSLGADGAAPARLEERGSRG